MNNVERIKEHLLPLLEINEDNVTKNIFKNVFNNVWKTDFIKTIKVLDEKCDISREKLEGLTLEQALNKYEKLINEWNPQKTLEVFWIKAIKVYDINQYQVLKAFYESDKNNVFNALINLKNKNKDSNIETLIKLALNNDLEKSHYKIFEKKNISFEKDKEANIKDFKNLVKIGKIYKSSLIWEYYIEFYKSNQIFINSAKEYLEKEKIEYDFEDKELDVFLKNKFTKTLQINPEFLCKHNTKITVKMLDDIVTGLNNFYHKLAKEIEENAEMEVSYKKAGYRIIMLHFENVESLLKYENKINDFQENLKEIISVLQVEKSKAISEYTKEIEKTYLYYHLQDKFEEKSKEKLKKI